MCPDISIQNLPCQYLKTPNLRPQRPPLSLQKSITASPACPVAGGSAQLRAQSATWSTWSHQAQQHSMQVVHVGRGL